MKKLCFLFVLCFIELSLPVNGAGLADLSDKFDAKSNDNLFKVKLHVFELMPGSDTNAELVALINRGSCAPDYVIVLPIGKLKDTRTSLQTDIADAMYLVANGIKPDAFKRRFDLEKWKADLSDLDKFDISGMKSSLSTLVGDLRGSAFKNGNKKDLLQQVVGINGKGGIAEFLGDLIHSLESESLTDTFKADMSSTLELLQSFDQ